MSNVLRAEKLSKTFHDAGEAVAVLHELDFAVAKAEMVGIIGVSGAGKSTLLHVLGGLDEPDDGQVFVSGQQLSAMSSAKQDKLRNEYLGFVYQFHHLLPEFNALENVAMPLLIRGLAPSAARAKAEAILKQVGLAARLKHRVNQLSGGERQRVAIARALVNEPKCVLADEPTGNLDEKTAQSIMELILELNATHETSFVIVTHNKGLANQMGRVLSLENGKLV